MLTRYNMSHRNLFNYTSFSFFSGFGIFNYWYLYPRIVERNRNMNQQHIKLIMDKEHYIN